MRLALVIASLGTGGAERVMSLLANAWAERGDDVSLITLESDEVDAYPLDPRITRVALGLVNDSGGLIRALTNNYRRIIALRNALIASRASVALSFEDTTNALVMVSTLGLPMRRVLSERTDPHKHTIGKAWRVLRRVTYPFADAVVVQTARLLPWARAVVLGRTRAHVIPNPLRSMDGCVGGQQSSTGAGSKPTIVALGRLGHEKGHDVLIRAFAKVASEFPDWTLAIIGEGPEREALTALAHSLDVAERLRLPGWMATPETELAQSAIFVMSSRYEGFSNATLEAMGLGLPVISTACGGSEEMISHGVNGMIVPIDDVDQLAGAMRELMGDHGLRRRIGLGALAVSQRYSARSIIPMWDTLLSEPCLPRPATKSFS